MDIDILEKLDFLNTKNDELEKANNELKEELKNKDTIIALKDNELNSKNDIIKNKEIEIDNIKNQLKSEKDDNLNKESKIQNLKSKIEDLESKISEYNTQSQLRADEKVATIEPKPTESSLPISQYREKRVEGVAVDASEHQEPSSIISSLSKLWLYRYYILGIISIILLVYGLYHLYLIVAALDFKALIDEYKSVLLGFSQYMILMLLGILIFKDKLMCLLTPIFAMGSGLLLENILDINMYIIGFFIFMMIVAWYKHDVK